MMLVPLSRNYLKVLAGVFLLCGAGFSSWGNVQDPLCHSGVSTYHLPGFTVRVNGNGYLDCILLEDGSGERVPFRSGSLFPEVKGPLTIRNGRGEVKEEGITYGAEYGVEHGALCLRAWVRNDSGKVFAPDRVRLDLGVDCYMESFPSWNGKMFPTLMRAERDGFWGYFMSPGGRVLLVASPDPVASWANDYEQSPRCFSGKQGYMGAHRIRTVFLDLMHRGPLPPRHPQHLSRLEPGKSSSFRLFFKILDSLREVKREAAFLTGIPVLDAELYTQEEGQAFCGTVEGDVVRMEIRSPRSELFTVPLKKTGEGRFLWSFLPGSGCGMYTCAVFGSNGKVGEGSLFVRPSLASYLRQARKAGLRWLPTETHHAECFYPFYSYFLSRLHVPEPELDSKAEEVFLSLFPKLFDAGKKVMRNGRHRIQDAATMAGILADRYAVTGEIATLENASGLADFLISCQSRDGVFRSGKTHYTSVIYPAKSIMEVMVHEKKLGMTDPVWKSRYERHLASVRAALDDLELRGDNIDTEGQLTFEDGMVSCSVAQLGMAALKETDEGRRARYVKRARELHRKHSCLSALLVPDCRMNGATMRFWEFQYTVNLMTNALNSPCGWSAWDGYGSWYLYLLTGEYEYLRQAFNTLGCCLQLLDEKTGELRFGFMVDPYIDACQFVEWPSGSGRPVPQRVVMGEQYVSQSSDWHKEPNATWRQKWGIDNFAHEGFKLMAEMALQNAYIVERPDGSVLGINCVVKQEGRRLIVSSAESLVYRLHVNLRNIWDIESSLMGGKYFRSVSGMKWLGGIPEELEPF